jgi:uncharacterized membrane protein
MTYEQPWQGRTFAVSSLHSTLISFPIACFSLTVLTDLGYMQTLNLLFLHFSEWLLLAGLVFGGLAAVFAILGRLFGSARYPWRAVLGGIVVLLLATLNSLVHTADGWTAVVPYGLALSVLTVLAMMVTAWLSWRGRMHV